MKISMEQTGILNIETETGMESYALKQWLKDREEKHDLHLYLKFSLKGGINGSNKK